MNVFIEKIQIVSFGKLKNTVISAEKGINILSAPNETGKSTLAAFIKFAFYGFSGTRNQKLSENEKKLYTPWDGEVSEGAIAFTADGEKYILHRRCLASGKEICEVVHRTTGKTEFQGLVPGEAIFGVGEEIFSRTLFFKQLTQPQSNDDVLADRLRDIAISADELVNTKKALKKLTDAKNELKGKAGNGIIPKLMQERDALEEEITYSTDLRRESARLSAELNKRNTIIKTNENKLELLKAERQNIEKFESLQKLQNITRLKQEENSAKEEYESVASGIKQQADSSVFGALSAKNAELMAEERNCQRLNEAYNKASEELADISAKTAAHKENAQTAEKILKTANKGSAIAFAFGTLMLVAGIILLAMMWVVPGGIIAAAGIACGIIGVVLKKRPTAYAKKNGMANAEELKDSISSYPALKQKEQEVQNRLNEARANYESGKSLCEKLRSELEIETEKFVEADGNNDFSQRIQQILSVSASANEKKALWNAKKEEYDKAINGIDLDALVQDARDAVPPQRQRSAVDMEINFYSKQISQLSELNRRDELELTACDAKSGDPAVLIGKRDALNNTIDELTLKHKAYETAIETINDAGSYMKSMVAPRISNRADEYFSLATNGKYSGLSIDTRVAMSFGEDFQRSCDYLSAGTRDSAYLSLRLALADLLFADGAPIILDDAFIRLDGERLDMMAKSLEEASKKHQIFIMTHSQRESDSLKNSNIPYTEMSFKTV